jgi:hypothetical protein
MAIGHRGAMTLLVVTLDDELHRRIAAALAHDGEITRIAPGETLPEAFRANVQFIIHDVRALERADALADVARYRAESGSRARCVAIARATDGASVDIMTTFADEVVTLVLADDEGLGELIRAHLNDPSRSAAAVTACDVALRLLPTATHETLRVVLGGGIRVSSVKQLAAHHHADRTSIGKALRKVTDWTSKDIIDTARASYAAMLLRQTTLTPQAIAIAIAFGKAESLDDLLEKTFELPARRIREHERYIGARTWLERELRAFIERRGGG